MQPFQLKMTLALCSIASCQMLAVMLLGAAAAGGADTSPVLLVPPADSVLHVAIDLPAGVKLDGPGPWQLVEPGGPAGKIPAQLMPAIVADGTAGAKLGRLIADIPPRPGAAGPRRLRLEPAPPGEPARKELQFRDLDDKSVQLAEGDKPVLVYHHGVITNEKVPVKDARRSRACYFHPVWGLHGEVLTDDFSKDHYHHHGVFWAWPHVGVGGKEYSLWTYQVLKPGFVRWLCQETGPVAAVLGVENGWFVGEKKVMIERVWLRAYRAAENERSLDIEFAWIPTDQPVTLRGAEGKSYGGLTVRFDVRNAKEAVITVPSGPAKEDLPETPLAWADLTTKFRDAAAPSGASIMVPRSHPDYPPTWLTRHYGAMCVGWPGVKDRTFEPGRPIRLAYRIWIHPTALDVQPLQQAYDGYLAAAEVKWEP